MKNRILYSIILLISMSGTLIYPVYIPPFNFNAVAYDAFPSASGFKVEQDSYGNIVALNDGKKTPLILGSIPTSERDLGKIATDFNVSKKNGVHVLSMNRRFELEAANEPKIFRNKKYVLLRYPTTDRTAPSIVDLIRVTRDLKNRDKSHKGLTYVHCREGIGRSATAVAAYLFCILYEAGYKVTMNQIEQYLKLCRSKVHINREQKKALALFAQELKKAKSLNALCKQYKKAVASRDRQFPASA